MRRAEGNSDSQGWNAGSADSWFPPQESLAKPRIKRLELSGAPIIEESHEYVIKKNDAKD